MCGVDSGDSAVSPTMPCQASWRIAARPQTSIRPARVPGCLLAGTAAPDEDDHREDAAVTVADLGPSTGTATRCGPWGARNGSQHRSTRPECPRCGQVVTAAERLPSRLGPTWPDGAVRDWGSREREFKSRQARPAAGRRTRGYRRSAPTTARWRRSREASLTMSDGSTSHKDTAPEPLTRCCSRRRPPRRSGRSRMRARHRRRPPGV
jgi:hypothetical protein